MCEQAELADETDRKREKGRGRVLVGQNSDRAGGVFFFTEPPNPCAVFTSRLLISRGARV